MPSKNAYSWVSGVSFTLIITVANACIFLDHLHLLLQQLPRDDSVQLLWSVLAHAACVITGAMLCLWGKSPSIRNVVWHLDGLYMFLFGPVAFYTGAYSQQPNELVLLVVTNIWAFWSGVWVG